MAEFVRVSSKLPSDLRVSVGGRVVVLNGVNTLPEAKFININGEGYAATTMIPKEDWDFVLSQIGSSELIKNGLVWISVSEKEEKAAIADKKEQKTGCEPIDPSVEIKDPEGNVVFGKTDL